MSSIDQRIVQMKFDNNQFETGVRQSSKTIESFKSNLNFDRERNSLNNLSAATRSFDASSMASAVDTIAQRFSSLGIVGMSVIQNLTNSAVNAGKRIASALTIDPIKSGFSEYELKMESIQTILTNTQATTKTVAVDNAQAIGTSASKAASSVSAASDAMREKITKNKEAELDAYRDALDVKIEAMEEERDKQLDILKDTHDAAMDQLEEQQDIEMELFKERYDAQVEEMEKAYERELELANEAHDAKLKMYDEEYMRKLKVLDEDKYNAIKDIDDEINSIKDLTKAEDEARKKRKEAEKIDELERQIANAETTEQRQKAEKALADLKEQIRRDEILKERADKIAALTEDKKNVTAQYQEKKEALKEEYDTKKQLEKESHDEIIKNIKEQNEELEKAAKKVYDQELKQFKKLQEDQRDALKDTQEDEIKAMQKKYDADRKLFDKEEKAKRKAIEERYDAELKAISKKQAASSGGGSIGGGSGVKTITTKGSNLDEINKALAELNEYADKTIYNFGDMTSAIGKFTAAGVDLDTSVSSIKGISNVAAGAGSSAQQASVAMYQLSQAIASGTVRLQDWMSVENAGMGGTFFQNELKKTAKEMGVVVDETKAFRYSLESGWLSAEVLTGTLSRLAEDESLLKAATQVTTFTRLMSVMAESVQSGWATTWEHILGNKNDSTELWTSIYEGFDKIAGSSADARNNMLEFWSANGGREAIIQGLINVFNGLMDVLSPIKQAFTEIFPATTGKQLVDVSNNFQALTEKFKIGTDTATKIRDTFKGLFSVLDIGRKFVVAGADAFGKLFSKLAPAGSGLLDITSTIGNFLTRLNEAITSTNIFGKAFDAGFAVVGVVASMVGKALSGVGEIIKNLFGIDMTWVHNVADTFETRFSPLTTLFGLVGAAFETLTNTIGKCASWFAKAVAPIGDVLKALMDKISSSLSNPDFNTLSDLVNGGLLAAILLGVKKFVNGLIDVVENADDFLEGFKNIFTSIQETFETLQAKLKADILIKIAGAIAILTASIVAISMIDSEKLTSSLVAIGVLITELFTSMAIFEKIMGSSGFTGIGKVTTAMIALSTAVLILSSAMVKIGSLDWDGVIKGLTSVAVLMGTLVVATKTMETHNKGIFTTSVALVVFGGAINVLATAVTKLSVLSTEGLIKGLTGVGVLLAEIAMFLKVSDLGGMSATKSLGFIALAQAVSMLADATMKFNNVDASNVTKGLVAIGAILAELALFVNLTGNATKVTATATGLLILSGAITVISDAVIKMGAIPIEDIGKGLLALGSSLTAIGVSMRLMPNNMISIGTGLLGVSVALIALSKAIVSMSSMSWSELAVGMTALGGSLGILAVALNVMNGTLAGSAAMTVAATALGLLVPSIKILGGMDLASVGIALVTLAGAFGVIGGAGVLLGPLTPAILGLSAAVGLLGVGVGAAGAGVLALSAGLTALAAAGTAGTLALTALISSAVALIPHVLVTIGEGLIDVVKLIGNSSKEIAEATTKIVKAVILVIKDSTVDIVDAIVTILDALLKTLAEHIPSMTKSAMDLLAGFLKGIADNIGNVISAATDIVINFITAIANNLPKIVDAGYKAIISFVDGITKALVDNRMKLIESFKNLFREIIVTIGLVITGGNTEILKKGAEFVGSLIQGLGSKMAQIGQVAREIVSKVCDNVKLAVGRIKNIGGDIIDGLVDGIRGSISKVTEWAKKIGDKLLDGVKDVLDINSPSKEFKMVGDFAGQGLVIGLKNAGKAVYKAGAEMGDKAKTALRSAIDTANEILDSDMDSTPTIRPVLDLSDVKNGVGVLGKMLDTNGNISIQGIKTKHPVDNTETIVKMLKDIFPKPYGPTNPQPVSSPNIVFNIYSQSGNPKQISREIQRDLNSYNRALGNA